MNLFTNDVRNSSVEDCIYTLDFLVGKINEVWPSCKIVISTGLPRSDSTELNDKIYECNIRLLNKYLGTDVQICDNSCLGSRGKPIFKFMDWDGKHLSKQGTSIFASNNKATILEALGEQTGHKQVSNQRQKQGYSSFNNQKPHYKQGSGNSRFMGNNSNRRRNVRHREYSLQSGLNILFSMVKDFFDL